MENKRHTRNIKKMRPTLAITFKIEWLSGGKKILLKPGMLPNALGPNRIPAIFKKRL